MSLITNYASNPKAVCQVKGGARVEFEGWKIASGVPSDHVVSAWCSLVSGTGTIRFGWDSYHTLNKSGWLTAYPGGNNFPKVIVVATGTAVWRVAYVIVTSREQYSQLNEKYGLDSFDGDTMPLA